ncbi:unnamed protein product [Victoria cruziana]
MHGVGVDVGKRAGIRLSGIAAGSDRLSLPPFSSSPMSKDFNFHQEACGGSGVCWVGGVGKSFSVWKEENGTEGLTTASRLRMGGCTLKRLIGWLSEGLLTTHRDQGVENNKSTSYKGLELCRLARETSMAV